jgi:hypothetical protein
LTVFTSFCGVFDPKTLPQKPGSDFFADAFEGRGLGSDINIFAGFRASFVFVQPRLADWFMPDITPVDFFLILGGSDHGIDGHFHSVGANQLGTDVPNPDLGGSAKAGNAIPRTKKMAINRKILETFMLGSQFAAHTD